MSRDPGGEGFPHLRALERVDDPLREAIPCADRDGGPTEEGCDE
jgi:hypothetical protein